MTHVFNPDVHYHPSDAQITYEAEQWAAVHGAAPMIVTCTDCGEDEAADLAARLRDSLGTPYGWLCRACSEAYNA